MASVTQDSFYARMVRRITARRRGIFRLTVLLMLLAALVAVTAAAAALDARFILDRPLRGALLLTMIVSAVLCLRQAWKWGRERNSHRDTVRRMEQSQPATGQMLRTAWEIINRRRRRSGEGGSPSGLDFDGELLRKSQLTTQMHSWNHLLPRGRLVAWLAVAVVCLGATALIARQWPDFSLGLRRVLSPGSALTYTQAVWTSDPRSYDDRHPPRLAVKLSGRAATPLLHLREAGGGVWQTLKLTALPDGRSHDVILTGKMKDLEAYVEAGDGVTPTLLLAYRPTPRLVDSAVTVTMPDYTGRAPDVRKGGDVTALEASDLTWAFTFNTPPARVDYQITFATEAPKSLPVRMDGTTARVSWPLAKGKFGGVLTVYDSSGASVDSWKYEISGVPDEMPKVEILEPSKDLEATSITELPVRVRAQDDYGVAELGLIMEAAGKTFWTMEKVIEAKDTVDVTEMTRAMLESVPLTVRDNVRVYAYALDHKPRGGPRAVSPLRSIDIRQFKTRSIFLGKAKGQGIPVGEIGNLNKLIIAQRAVVSDTHVLREPARTESEAAMVAPCGPVVLKENVNLENTTKLHKAWEEEPRIPRDDVVLLATARQQMEETVPLLGQGMVEKAFTRGDRALSTLLQIRKHIMKLIMESDAQGEPEEPEKRGNPQDFIKEALRLAAEERAVRQQIAPDSSGHPQADPAVSRRQQEVALSDAGELYAALMAYEKRNNGMLSLMRQAETSMKQADGRLHSALPLEAVPSLSTAEQGLRDLADFLKAMDPAQLAETLKQMASKAEQDAKKSAQDQADSNARGAPGSPAAGAPADGKNQPPQVAEAGEKGEKKPDSKSPEAAEKNAGGKDGKESGEAESKQAAEARRQAALADAARNAALADEILKALAAQAAAAGEEPAAGDGKTAEDVAPRREDLEELRKRAGTEELAKDLKQLTAAGKSPKPGADGKAGAGEKEGKDAAGGKEGKEGGGAKGEGEGVIAGDNPGKGGVTAGSDPGKGGGIGDRLSEMAGQLRAEANRLQSSRLAKLEAVRAQAKALLEKRTKEEAPKEPEEVKDLKRQLLAQGYKPGTQFQMNGKKYTLGKPEEKGGEGDKPGGEGKEGEGDKPGVDGKPGKGEQPGQGANGEAKSSVVAPATERFVADARKLNDEPITRMIRPGDTGVTDFDVPTLTGIIQRLDTLVGELPAGVEEQAPVNHIPEKNRREVEDYYKNLSDHIGDE